MQPVAMAPNGTGDRKLWNVTVQINASNVDARLPVEIGLRGLGV